MGKEDLQAKPEQIRAKIVEGRMQKRVKEVALLEQPFIKDQDKTVNEVCEMSVWQVDFFFIRMSGSLRSFSKTIHSVTAVFFCFVDHF